MGLAFGRALLRGGVVGLAVLASAGGSAWADPPPEGDRGQISLASDTTIEDFLLAVGKKLGARIAWDPSTKLIKDKRIVAGDLRAEPGRMLSLVRGMLVPYDLALVPMGSESERWYFVMDAKQQGAIVKLKPETIELTDRNLARYEAEDGLFVSATIRIQHLRSLRDARTALTKVTTQNLGNVTEVPDANAFVVTDFAPNVVGIYRLIRQLDVAEPVSPGRLVPLRHARAQTVAQLLHAHFAPPPPAPANPQQAPQAHTPPAGPRINFDARTNQLLLGGSAAEIEAALKLIEGLDVAVEASAPIASTTSAPQSAHVLTLKHAKAQDLANVLRAVVNSSVVWIGPDGNRPSFTPDPATNVLVVAAPEKSMPAIRALVESLDVAPPAREPPPEPAVAAATERLRKSISVNLADQKLGDALAHIAAAHAGLGVYLDVPEAVVTRRVTLDAQDTPASALLDALAVQHGLAWKVQRETLVHVTLAPAR